MGIGGPVGARVGAAVGGGGGVPVSLFERQTAARGGGAGKRDRLLLDRDLEADQNDGEAVGIFAVLAVITLEGAGLDVAGNRVLTTLRTVDIKEKDVDSLRDRVLFVDAEIFVGLLGPV